MQFDAKRGQLSFDKRQSIRAVRTRHAVIETDQTTHQTTTTSR